MEERSLNRGSGAPHPRTHTKARPTGPQLLEQLSSSSHFVPVSRRGRHALQQQPKAYDGPQLEAGTTPGVMTSSLYHQASSNVASTPCPVTDPLQRHAAGHGYESSTRNRSPPGTLGPAQDRHWRAHGSNSRRRGSSHASVGESTATLGVEAHSNMGGITPAESGRRASDHERSMGSTESRALSGASRLGTIGDRVMHQHDANSRRQRGSVNSLRIDPRLGSTSDNASGDRVRDTETSERSSAHTRMRTRSGALSTSSHKRASRTLTRDPFGNIGRDPMASAPTYSSQHEQEAGAVDFERQHSYAQMHLAEMAHSSSKGPGTQPRTLPIQTRSSHAISLSRPEISSRNSTTDHDNQGSEMPSQKVRRCAPPALTLDEETAPTPSSEMAKDFTYVNCERVETRNSANRTRLSTAPAPAPAPAPVPSSNVTSTSDVHGHGGAESAPRGPNFPEVSEKMFDDPSAPSRHRRASRRRSQFSIPSATHANNKNNQPYHSNRGITSRAKTDTNRVSQNSKFSYPVLSAPDMANTSHSLSPHKPTSQPYSNSNKNRNYSTPTSATSPMHNLSLLKRKTSLLPRRHLNTAPSLRAYDSSATICGTPRRQKFPFSKPDTAASAPGSPTKTRSITLLPCTTEQPTNVNHASEYTRLLHSSQEDTRRSHTRSPASPPSSRRGARDLPVAAPHTRHSQACSRVRSDDALLPSDQRRSRSPGPQNPFLPTNTLGRHTPPRKHAIPPREHATPPHKMLRRARSQVPDRTVHARRLQRIRTATSSVASHGSAGVSSGPDPTFSPTAGGRFSNNPVHLDSITDAWVKTLSLSTTIGSDWQGCMECLAKIRKLVRSPDVPSALAFKLVAKFRGPLVIQLNGLRSTLVKSVCGTLSEIFEVFGDKYARTAGLYLSPLFKQLQASGALSGPAHQCILAMISHVRFPYFIEFLLERASTSKAAVLRVHATQYLDIIVLDKEWRRVVHFRDSVRLGEFLSFVIKQTDDCKDTVRKEARKLAADFAQEYPQTASGIFKRASTRTQRLLVKESWQTFEDHVDENWKHVLAGKLSHASRLPSSSVCSYESASRFSSSSCDSLSRTQQLPAPKRDHSAASIRRTRTRDHPHAHAQRSTGPPNFHAQKSFSSQVPRDRWSRTLPPR